MLPTMKVNVLLVRESCSRRVSFDSRKGATAFPLPLLSEAMTLPRVVRDWLIFLSSLKWASDMLSDLLIFSEPAKSHKLSRAFYITSAVP